MSTHVEIIGAVYSSVAIVTGAVVSVSSPADTFPSIPTEDITARHIVWKRA